MVSHFLEFERPVLEILTRMDDLRGALERGEAVAEKDPEGELRRLDVRMARVMRLLYRHLTPIQKVQVARHPERPQGNDYINELIADFVPLAGDRRFGEDKAMLAGIGRLKREDGTAGEAVAVLAIDKGKTTAERLARNFGMPKPEGYRKAQRIMKMADSFGLPIVAFVDTPGAYPGIDAEERGQAQAIAECLEILCNVNVPVVSVITGEGGSGGALALAVADKVLMLEHSIYSVISPEGCAAILWKEANKDTVPAAADVLKLTAQDLEKFGVIDGIIREPVGGAQRDPVLALRRVRTAVEQAIAEVRLAAGGAVARREKFLKLS